MTRDEHIAVWGLRAWAGLSATLIVVRVFGLVATPWLIVVAPWLGFAVILLLLIVYG